MVNVDEPAPNFTLPASYGDSYDDVGEFTLAESAHETVVLAFFPAAFTGGCTEEMCNFRDSIAQFNDSDAQVYGISVDLPPALNVFSQKHGLTFPLLSDFNQVAIEKYDVVRENLYGVTGVARRSIFVVHDGTVVYRWVKGEDEELSYAALVEEAERAVAERT